MRVRIIKENSDKPFSWYNSVPETKYDPALTSKVGVIYEVSDYDETHFVTEQKVVGNKVQGLIRKKDCEIL
jgi:hypothetical protein